jgi:hypothetical protein
MDMPIQNADTSSEVEPARRHCAELNTLLDTALGNMSTGLRQLQSAEKAIAAFIRLAESPEARSEYALVQQRLRRVTAKELGVQSMALFLDPQYQDYESRQMA